MVEFAGELRRLRERAGRPGYRELARRAHYSATALSEAAAGRQLPTLAVALAYVTACGGDPDEWTGRWRRAAAEVGAAAAAPTGDDEDGDRGPYRGLAAYGPDDAAWFFGRAELTAEVVARLAERRFLAVFGPSGVGKSSLLRAGVLPAVRDGAVTGGHPAVVVSMTPGADPLGELAVRLAGLAGVAAGPVREDLAGDPAGAELAVRQALADTPAPGELVLLVDQFEEVFTACHDPAQRQAFVAALLAVAGSAAGRARVVLGVRADFYGDCAGLADLVEGLRDAQVLVGAMSATELREAVARPAERAGLMVEADLVSTVVAEVADRPGALPLASHALLEAWRRRRGNAVTLAGYTAAGGVHGALAQTAERIYTQLSDAGQEVARGLLLRLVEIGPDGQATRRRVRREELDTDDPAADAVLEQLTAARLLSARSDTVEVAHEALLEAWPRLRGWIDDDRSGLRLHRQLTEAVAVWESLDRDPGALHRGVRLSATAQWAVDRPGRLSPAEREFLEASRAAESWDRTARRRRVRLALAGLGAAVVAVSVLAGLALVQADRASAERDLARSRQVLAEARAQLPQDPELALLLARHAHRLRPTADTVAVLRQATAESRVVAVLTGEAPVRDVTFSPDGQQVAYVQATSVVVRDWASGRRSARLDGQQYGAATYSPDGRRLALTRVVGGEGPVSAVSVWTVGDQSPLDRADITQMPLSKVAFGPEGYQVLGIALDGTVWAWGSTGAPQMVLRSGTDVTATAFGPAGERVAIGRVDGSVGVYDLTTTTGPEVVLGGHGTSIHAVTFSPDGQQVAVGGFDGSVRIWQVSGAGEPVVLRGHDGPVVAVAFDPDGRRIVTAGSDRTVRIWEVGAGGRPLVLRGHQDPVSAVEFSPDGRHVASGGADGTVRIWDATGRADPLLHDGPSGNAGPTALSPNGQHLVTAHADGTVQVSGTGTPSDPELIYRGHDEPALLAVSDDGRTVASASNDGAVRVSSPAGGTGPRTLRCDETRPPWETADGPVPVVGEVVVSPSGRRVAVQCTVESTVEIWRTAVDEPPTVLHGSAGPLAFSADGARLASIVEIPYRIRVTDLSGPDDPVHLDGLSEEVTHTTFSPDGNRLAAASRDGTVRIWNAGTGADPVVLPGHAGTNGQVAFSPDGRLVATTGNDGAIRLWERSTDTGPVVLAPYPAPYATVAFTGSDQRLVTVHTDGTIRTWPCGVCAPVDDVLALAAARTTRELTPQERRTYL